MCREWEFGRRLALLFADSHRHSYSGCKPGMSDVLCGAAMLAAEANNIQKISHIREKLSNYAGAAELAYAAGVASAIYGEKTSSGVFFPNKIYANVGRRLTGELIYHEYNLLTEIAGGIAVTLPFEEDFHAESTKKYLDKFIVRNPKLSPEISLKIWKFVENIGASPMSSWYEIAGVHGGGSPIMETIALNLDYDFDEKKRLGRYLSGIDETFDDSRALGLEPTFGTSLATNDRQASEKMRMLACQRQNKMKEGVSLMKEEDTKKSLDKRMTLKEAISKYVFDGCSIAFSGMGGEQVVAPTYEIVRQGQKNLTLMGDSPCEVGDYLVGTGQIKRIEVAWLAFAVAGVSPSYRRAVEEGAPS